MEILALVGLIPNSPLESLVVVNKVKTTLYSLLKKEVSTKITRSNHPELLSAIMLPLERYPFKL